MPEEVFLVDALVGVVHADIVALEVRAEGYSLAAELARVGAAAGGIKLGFLARYGAVCVAEESDKLGVLLNIERSRR